MTNKIMETWRQMKPYSSAATDTYYAHLAGRIQEVLLKHDQERNQSPDLHPLDFPILGCFLASYLEDVVSGSRFWQTFVENHESMYGKPLPIFEISSDYYKDEINIEDVQFLLWYLMTSMGRHSLNKAYIEALKMAAEPVMDILDEVYEYAPENKKLLEVYRFPEEEVDFYKARNFVANVLFNGYLFNPDVAPRVNEEEDLIKEKYSYLPQERLYQIMLHARDLKTHNLHTQLLAWRGPEWTAHLLGPEHPRYHDFLDTSMKIDGLFSYQGEDHTGCHVEHIASGKKFAITKKADINSSDFPQEGGVIFMGIVRWREEWFVSGLRYCPPYDPNLVSQERHSAERKSDVAFLDQYDEIVLDSMRKQEHVFKQLNNGSSIAFMWGPQVPAFMTQFLNACRAYFTEEARKEGREMPVMPPPKVDLEPGQLGDKPYVVYFNPKYGIEILQGVTSAFPLPHNPCFKLDEHEDAVSEVLYSRQVSPEIAYFCIEHCRDQLPFFDTYQGRLFLDNLDFLLRFFKLERYHSRPNLLALPNEDFM